MKAVERRRYSEGMCWLAAEQTLLDQRLFMVSGIGTGMLQDAIRSTLMIAEQAGVRAMLTHPIDEDAARFYTRFGLIASPLREQQLLLLLKDAKKAIR